METVSRKHAPERPVHEESEPAARPPIAFYTVADRHHFIGVAGLVNSLRLIGHDEPIFLLDCGLEERQREQLAAHVRIVPASKGGPATSVKNIAPLAYPADVMVILDADVIVTGRLDEPIEAARAGRLAVFPDDTPERFFPEWSALGLGEPRRRTYVSAGHLVAPASLAETVLRRVDALAEGVDPARTFVAGGDPDDPLYYLDQDVFNAVLATVVEHEQIELLDSRLAAYTPFRGLRLVDEGTLTCEYDDGTRPVVLHHVLAKPWLRALRPNVYSRLLTRLLWGPDLAVKVDPGQIPLRLRTTPLARVDRLRASTQASIRHHTRGRLGIRRRIARRKRLRSDVGSQH